MMNGKGSKLLPQHKKMAMGEKDVGFSGGGSTSEPKMQAKKGNYAKKGYYNMGGTAKKYVK